jgi:hypothetical protein
MQPGGIDGLVAEPERVIPLRLLLSLPQRRIAPPLISGYGISVTSSTIPRKSFFRQSSTSIRKDIHRKDRLLP